MSSRITRASPISANDVIEKLVTETVKKGGKILDLGAGRGYMSCRLAQLYIDAGLDPAKHITACDISETNYQCHEVPFQRMDANAPLPFPDNTFDAVYAIEVFEHLGRPFDAMAEIHRILKPGGLIVFSVPNILHMQSRLTYLMTGFYTLYVPPTANPNKAGNISGHIMPLSYAYLAYGLRSAGYNSIAVQADRLKRGALIWLIMLWPFLRLASWRYSKRIEKYDHDVYTENIEVLKRTNSPDMLMARSAIVSAIK